MVLWDSGLKFNYGRFAKLKIFAKKLLTLQKKFENLTL